MTVEDSGAVEVRVAAQAHNLGAVRALVSAVAAFEDLTIDAVADLRLALDEAATLLIRAAVPDTVLTVTVRPREETVVVDASAVCPAGTVVVTPSSFSWHVLSSLADEVRIFTSGDEADAERVFGISLTLRRWESTL